VTAIEELYTWALEKYFAMPYQWGGEGPPSHWGVDCSGLVQCILRRAKLDPPGDQSAAALYEHAVKNWVPDIKARGAVAFFGKETRITHVGWMVDKYCVLNASGGGAHINTLIQAQQQKANVKIQPIAWFKTPAFVRAFMPDYGKVGLV
jgi:cell wall-associated NlpC family hydrolase